MSLTAVAEPLELEIGVLGVLLNAESARGGAAEILEVLSPLVDDAAVAIAARGRDGTSLHVLAERGAPQRWPMALAPQSAGGAERVIDAATSSMVIPLHARGRVCGALLFGDTALAAELLHDGPLSTLLDSIAAVLHALLASSDAQVRRRASALRTIDRVIDGIAHQIANPLTGAAALAQLLELELPAGEHREALAQIRQELRRAFDVVEDLLEFRRDTRAHDGILDLNTVAERVVRFRGYSIRERGIALALDTARGFLPVRADARGLEHALLMALRAAELQSQSTVNRSILVRVRERSEIEVVIDVVDSGPGVAPDLTPRYFDLAFSAEDRQRQSDDEADLGLVESILSGCGGRLEVRSSKTDGTTLSLVLPKAAVPVPVANARTQS